MKRLTITEIARLANVSPATVSRVLNNHPNVRQDVRSRVLKMIDESGYVPSAAARSLANRRTHVICLLLPRAPATMFGSRYHAAMIPEIAERCNEAGYLLTISMLSSEEMEKRFYYQALRSRQFDGVIVLDPEMDEPILPFLLKDNIPFVMFGRHAYLKNITWVDVDNREGGRMAVTHLLKLGYRRIATITGPLTRAWGIDRRDGYKQALVEGGITVDPQLIVESDSSQATGYQAMMRLLRLPEPPDALFAPSEPIELGALRAIHEMGLTVPDDIALVGYDDFVPASFGGLRMTTVVQPIKETAAAAVDLLMERIEHPERPHVQKVLPVELIVRDSCGAGLRAVQQM